MADNRRNEPEICFEGFEDEWKEKRLSELAEVKDSARIPNSKWTSEGVPYIRASDVSNNDLTCYIPSAET